MACVCRPSFARSLVFMWKSVHLVGREKQPPNWRRPRQFGLACHREETENWRRPDCFYHREAESGRLREGDVQLWFYIAAAAATDWSRIDAARPTSVTPKITNGEFVLGSTPQYA